MGQDSLKYMTTLLPKKDLKVDQVFGSTMAGHQVPYQQAMVVPDQKLLSALFQNKHLSHQYGTCRLWAQCRAKISYQTLDAPLEFAGAKNLTWPPSTSWYAR